MVPIFDTFMINSKRKAGDALAVYCVYTRLAAGFFLITPYGLDDEKKI